MKLAREDARATGSHGTRLRGRSRHRVTGNSSAGAHLASVIAITLKIPDRTIRHDRVTEDRAGENGPVGVGIHLTKRRGCRPKRQHGPHPHLFESGFHSMRTPAIGLKSGAVLPRTVVAGQCAFGGTGSEVGIPVLSEVWNLGFGPLQTEFVVKPPTGSAPSRAPFARPSARLPCRDCASCRGNGRGRAFLFRTGTRRE
jgi:hypothetical protein